MVGGFSQSPVLYDRMESAFPNMEVICPQDAVLAIVKGAVMFGNNPRLIQERISQEHTGYVSMDHSIVHNIHHT
jgi:hypothetical protein